MQQNQFARFADALTSLDADGVQAPELVLGREKSYELRYIPFEHVNRNAKLVIVGITPGNNQLALAYKRAQDLLKAGKAEADILREVKKAAAFGGSGVRPNLLRMLRHFHFERLLGISDVETLWGPDAHLLHTTSVVPHAAFRAGRRFAGSFREIMASSLLAECFMDCFVASVREISTEALFIGLGPCPQAALDWCVRKGVLQRGQVLGAFCHPSAAGGSRTRYYLREVKRADLRPGDPVLKSCDWLDEAYRQMKSATRALVGGDAPCEPAPQCSSMLAPVTESTAQREPHGRRRDAERSNEAELDVSAKDVPQLVSQIRNAGYRSTKETKKLTEFESPTGEVVYLVKTTSRLNSINLMVHPYFQRSMLHGLQGVADISREYRFHSNMTRFPKRKNNGESETAHGWQVRVDTVGGLGAFLEAFARLER